MEKRQEVFGEQLADFRPTQWEQIPDLGLYMDQVITFLQRQCKALYQNKEKVCTPAMVNNYVKMGLVLRPTDKKYGREQLAQLLMICTLKQAASAEGMKMLLEVPEGSSLQTHYGEFCGQQSQAMDELAKALPLPSVMHCAVQSAAYAFLCNALLQKENEDPKNKPKAAQALPSKDKAAIKPAAATDKAQEGQE